MTKPITIHDLVEEMQTWINEPAVLEKAKNSKINTDTNKEFARLVRDWGNGLYDNDPDMVVVSMVILLNKEK